MRTSAKELLDNYQVRKSFKQKQLFIEWMSMHAGEHGYKIKEQHYKIGRGRNLIVGNPEEASIILTAHYDTPPSALFPMVTIVGNIPVYIFSQAFIYIPVITIFWLLLTVATAILGDLGHLSEMIPFFWFEVPLLILVLLILWSFQMMRGFANRKNANDNTSGVLVLLSLLEDLQWDKRSKVCFVFFDDEEKGFGGSKVFRRYYRKTIVHKPLINFDCVAHGRYFMFITKKKFRESRYNDILADVTEGKVLITEAKKYVYPSDQLIFKNSVGVVALHKMPILGYYLSRLHSRLDSKFNEDNIEALNQMMRKFIEKITEHDKSSE